MDQLLVEIVPKIGLGIPLAERLLARSTQGDAPVLSDATPCSSSLSKIPSSSSLADLPNTTTDALNLSGDSFCTLPTTRCIRIGPSNRVPVAFLACRFQRWLVPVVSQRRGIVGGAPLEILEGQARTVRTDAGTHDSIRGRSVRKNRGVGASECKSSCQESS